MNFKKWLEDLDQSMRMVLHPSHDLLDTKKDRELRTQKTNLLNQLSKAKDKKAKKELQAQIDNIISQLAPPNDA